MSRESESLVRGPFVLGEWEVEPIRFRIVRGASEVQLRPRAMEVLLCLADRAGQVVSKRRLIDAVWRAEYVSENALTHVIAELRTALEDDAQSPTYIETVPRRGYRLLVQPVERAEIEAPADGRPRVGDSISRYRIREVREAGGALVRGDHQIGVVPVVAH